MDDDMHQAKTAIEEIRKEIQEEKLSKGQLSNSIKVLSEKVDTMRQEIDNINHMLQKIMKLITTTGEKDLKKGITFVDLVNDNYHDDEEVLPKSANITGPSHDVLNDDQSTVFTWKIPDFREKLQCLKNLEAHCIKSPVFLTKEHGLRVKVKLGYDISNKNLDIFLEWEPSSPAYWHARQFTLLDQSDRLDKKHVSIIDTPLFSKDPSVLMMRPSFVDHMLAPVALLEQDDTYLRADAVLIRVHIRPLSLMFKSVASRDGILLWRIDHYASRKRDEIQNIQRFLNSQPFYTSPLGYRMLAHLHLDGHQAGKGKYIMIYLGVIIGEFDHALPFPFRCMVKLFLLDQSDSTDKQHVSCQFAFTCQEGHTYMGQNFVLQSTAEEAPYLKDDTLLFKIMVETV